MISRDRLWCRYATREYFGDEGPWDESHGEGMFHRAAMGGDIVRMLGAVVSRWDGVTQL